MAQVENFGTAITLLQTSEAPVPGPPEKMAFPYLWEISYQRGLEQRRSFRNTSLLGKRGGYSSRGPVKPRPNMSPADSPEALPKMIGWGLFFLGVFLYPLIVVPLYLLDLLAPLTTTWGVLAMVAAPLFVWHLRPRLRPLAIGMGVSFCLCSLVFIILLSQIQLSLL